MANIGNTSGSALVKSAASIASTVADYNDKLAAAQWSNSAQTDADWQQYQNYLSGRIDSLNNTGALTDVSKAVSLTSTLEAANRSYVSNTIQRSSQAILEGTGTATDKLSTIDDLYYQAVANGDDNLAQNLVSQHDTLSQQIQYDQQTAATAQQTLYTANQNAQAQGYSDAETQVKAALASFSNGFKTTGQGFTTKTLTDESSSIIQTAKSLGVDIPTGSAANNGSIVQAAFQTVYALEEAKAAIYNATPGGTASYNSALQSMDNINSGVTTLSVGGQSLTYEDATYYAEHPDAYHQVTTGTNIEGQTTYGLAKSAVQGYAYDKNGVAQPIYTVKDAKGNVVQGPTGTTTYQAQDANGQKQMQADLTQAGFSVRVVNGNLIATPSSDGKNAFFNNAVKGYGLDPGTGFNVVKTAAGYQFSPVVSSSGSSVLLTLAKDNTGKFGIYNNEFNPTTGTQSNNLIGSFNGFNPINNTQVAADPTNGLAGYLKNAFADPNSLKNGSTESTIIPNVAKQFFNGDSALAATAVYNYRKPLETPTNPSVIAPSANLSTPTVNGNANIVAKPTPVSSSLSIPTVNGAVPDVNTAIKTAFANYKTAPQGYTESTILPQIAKQYFGGNIKAASAPVYQYRAATFGS